jgi:hypothetical protein
MRSERILTGRPGDQEKEIREVGEIGERKLSSSLNSLISLLKEITSP